MWWWWWWYECAALVMRKVRDGFESVDQLVQLEKVQPQMSETIMYIPTCTDGGGGKQPLGLSTTLAGRHKQSPTVMEEREKHVHRAG